MPKYGATTCWLCAPPSDRVISAASCRRMMWIGSSGDAGMQECTAAGGFSGIILLLRLAVRRGRLVQGSCGSLIPDLEYTKMLDYPRRDVFDESNSTFR
jgi:hypothetical protein